MIPSGVAGCCELASVVSAPSSVTIATSSSGNHNNSFGSYVDDCGWQEGTSGNAFSSYVITVNVDVANMAAQFDGCANSYNTTFQAYLRATGATSFAWQLGIISSSLTGVTIAINGTASTSQDSTGTGISGSIGKYLTLSFGGGRGGIVYPSAGDEIVVRVNADATNGTGTTSAQALTMTFNFMSS